MNLRHVTAERRSARLVPLAFLAFVSLGLPDGVLGVAWPALRRAFEKPVDQLGPILLAMMAGYLSSSFCAGRLVARFGVGRLLLGSSLLVAASAAAWALAPAWPVVVAGGLVTGLGAGAIDSGINAYAAAHFTPGIITWLHACWGVGAMLGPLAMTAALASGLGWRWGYAALAASLAALAVSFRLTLASWDTPTPRPAGALVDTDPMPPATAATGIGHVLRSPAVRANALVFFVYAGVEASAGQWASTLLLESRGLATATAGLAASAYWGSIFVGRAGFGVVARHVSPDALLRSATCVAPLAAAALWTTRGSGAAFASLFALGLVLAPIFPLLIAETPARVGRGHADHAIGVQIAAATLGAGGLPALAGAVMRRFGLEALGAFLLVLAALLVVLHERARRHRGAGRR